MSSGASPFANGREAPQARNRFRDTPELPQTILRNKLIYKFTKDYAMPKISGLGRNPFWLLERSHVQSVSRYGRPEPYKQTLHSRSSAPPLVKGHNSPPDPVTIVGHPNLLTTKYK